ncbi:hypothetical protein ADK49_29840 [Streptomyces sp. WM6349]|nr:hypothetical protein ADK49_29840 [Streptomyces sp. WM6349]KOV52840.1 hypothetical protein ADK98_04790 [Streptomyces sp. H036]
MDGVRRRLRRPGPAAPCRAHRRRGSDGPAAGTRPRLISATSAHGPRDPPGGGGALARAPRNGAAGRSSPRPPRPAPRARVPPARTGGLAQENTWPVAAGVATITAMTTPSLHGSEVPTAQGEC